MKTGFVFDTQQRKGIFGLILVIIALFIIIFWQNKKYLNEVDGVLPSEEVRKIRAYLDSVSLASEKPKPAVLFPFNPNFMTDYQAYVLGLSLEEIDRLHQYRAANKWVNSKEDFQHVTEISDSLLNVISPLFKFPEWVNNSNILPKGNISGAPMKKAQEDLNTATIEDLQKMKGIGPVLSQRIVRYRNQIGGFIDDIQLKDIYGLDYETRLNLLQYFKVKNPPVVEKLDLNSVGIEDLTGIPYINYELARKIIAYRILHEGFKSFEELTFVEGFPIDKIERVQLYLSLKLD